MVLSSVCSSLKYLREDVVLKRHHTNVDQIIEKII